MAEVTLTIGDRRHLVTCRDGQEPVLRRLGGMLDERWPQATRAANGAGGERAMLFLALMLADALDEADRAPPKGLEEALGAIATRLEALAATLEQSDPSA